MINNIQNSISRTQNLSTMSKTTGLPKGAVRSSEGSAPPTSVYSSRPIERYQALYEQQRAAEVQTSAATQISEMKGGGVNGVSPSPTLDNVDADFATKIRELLIPDAQGNIHEEELQYAVATYLLDQVSPEAGAQFTGLVSQIIGSGAPPVSAEDAVKMALKQLVSAGTVTPQDAESINGISFMAAQLDTDLTALFDGTGSTEDTTIALMSFDEAIAKAWGALEAMERGELLATARSLDTPSNVAPSKSLAAGDSATGDASVHGGGGTSNEFLWKPVSESNGKLVVLLPASLTGRVESAAIYTAPPEAGGQLIEQGRFSGDQHNGGRAHFRFSKEGGDYPDGAYVVAELKDGSTETFKIGDSSARNEL